MVDDSVLLTCARIALANEGMGEIRVEECKRAAEDDLPPRQIRTEGPCGRGMSIE